VEGFNESVIARIRMLLIGRCGRPGRYRQPLRLLCGGRRNTHAFSIQVYFGLITRAFVAGILADLPTVTLKDQDRFWGQLFGKIAGLAKIQPEALTIGVVGKSLGLRKRRKIDLNSFW
jgi:hypothetical protein